MDKQRREERKQRIFDLWLAGHSQDEIASLTETRQQTLAGLLPKLEELPNSVKVQADFGDSDWSPPLFNVWTFAKDVLNVCPWSIAHIRS